MRRLPLLAATGLLLSACSSPGWVALHLQASDRSVNELRAVPTTLGVGGKPLQVSASAWHSTSGGVNPNPFIVSVTAKTGDGSAFPEGVTPEGAYLIRGEGAWWGGFTREGYMDPAGERQKVIRTADRALFPDGTRMEVVVRLNTPQGTKLLRVAQPVQVYTPN